MRRDEFTPRLPDVGNYRVIGVDTFAGTDWHVGDFATKEVALATAEALAGPMTKMHVYNSTGKRVTQFGEF